MDGQLTLIAGRDGPVYLRCHEIGAELDTLERLRDVWRGDLKAEVVMIAQRVASAEVLKQLGSRWLGGHLYRRDVLNRLPKLIAKERLKDANAE